MAEPVFTVSRGEVSRNMLKHYVATSPALADPRHLVREDFEGAGIRVAERRPGAEALSEALRDLSDLVYARAWRRTYENFYSNFSGR